MMAVLAVFGSRSQYIAQEYFFADSEVVVSFVFDVLVVGKG